MTKHRLLPAPRAEFRADLHKDPEAVAHMFDAVAPRYDLTNGALSLGQVYVWRRAVRAALAPHPGQSILDVAAGTGTSSLDLARGGAQVVCADLSDGMIEVGRALHPELEFVRADAADLPFDDASFDAVTCSFGLRNMARPEVALREMLRVTKHGGELVVCEFSRPAFPPLAALYRFYLRAAIPLGASLVSSDHPAYAYLAESILEWPDQRGVARMLARAGWSDVEYRNLSGGIVALHRGVRR